MKKGLLLSIAASAFIFAGGDIAPVEPAAPASADFWGQIGFRYDANNVKDLITINPATGGLVYRDRKFNSKTNNAFSTAVVLGVEKELGYGFGFGAELAGWTDFGLKKADFAAVDQELNPNLDQTAAEISQAYVTYSFGNTAIKAGRQALPKAVSPWAWSHRSVGVIDISYDAVVIANTDLENTTLVGAWVANAVNQDNIAQLGVGHHGIFMLAAINKSLANTTIAVSGYYAPKYNIKYHGAYLWGKAKDEWSLWGSSMTQFDGWHLGLQGAYVDGGFANTNATYGVAAKVGSSWGNLDAELVAAYINNGDYSLKTAGTGLGTSAFWGESFAGFFTSGDIVSDDQTIVRVDAGYKLNYGKVFGGLAYVTYGNKYIYNDGYGFRVGYKFPILNSGVNANIEYRYATYNGQSGIKDFTKQRVRVEAYYKF